MMKDFKVFLNIINLNQEPVVNALEIAVWDTYKSELPDAALLFIAEACKYNMVYSLSEFTKMINDEELDVSTFWVFITDKW